MNNRKSIIIYLFFVTIILSCSPRAFSAGADVINTHTMDILKQNQVLLQEMKDFNADKEKREKQNKDTPSKDIKHAIQIQKNEVKPALPEEYQIKGVYIGEVVFSPSQILSEEEINNFRKELVGKNVFMKDINAVINKINDLYAEKGFVTARAFLPPQTIEKNVLTIKLVEGKVGNIKYVGNKWTKQGYISHRMEQKSGDLFEIPVLESNIVKFNRYNDNVKLKATLEAGQKPETTDITLKVDEQLPFHYTTLWDNAGRTTIGKQRVGFMLGDDSLFGHRDKLTLGTYLTSGSTTPFVDYNIPINKYDGRLGFSFSSSFADILNGNYQMFNIRSRSYNYALYLNQPIIRKSAFELSSMTSLNYKQATTSFDKYDLYTDKITSLETGLNAKYDSKRGIWYANQSVYQAFPIFSDASKYFKMNGDLIRLHDFGHNIIGQFRADYQWSANNVIPYTDQYQSGGIASVRGFSEGVLIGKSGYLFSAEILYPILPSTVKINDKNVNFLGKYMKGVFFIDHSAVFPFKGKGPGAEGIVDDDYLTAIGPGLRITLPANLTARLYWGFPLGHHNYHETDYKATRFHFEISLEPDFDKLLKLRKQYKKKDSL